MEQLTNLLFRDRRMAWLWLIVRFYVGWEWLTAGWSKFQNPAWNGAQAGTALKGFLAAAMQKTSGMHPDVSAWYGWFIEHVALQHTTLLSYLVTYGEILVGIALILGLFTSIGAFFGAFMNMNYLLAGTLSTNPVLLLLAISLLAAHSIAGWYGVDRFAMPKLWGANRA